MNDSTELLSRAIAHYGMRSQMIVAVEELSELQKEICKNLRNENNVDHIAEEIADVKIMLEQLEIVFDCTDSVRRWQNFKLQRLADRIRNDGESDGSVKSE